MAQETLSTESPIARLSPRKQQLLLRHLAARLAPQEAETIRRRSAGAGRFPLSFAQQRLWFLDRLQPASSAYIVSESLRLSGRLDRSALAAALAEVVRRHDVLRATFELESGGPVQVIAPYRGLSLPLVDLAALEPPTAQAEVYRLAAAAAALPFDLGTGPLFRLLLLECGASEHALLLAFHHTVCDAWSMDLLFSELRALYRGFAAGHSIRLPTLPIQYPDFAGWQREWLQGEVLENQLAYWRQRLAGASCLLALPVDRQRPPVATAAGDRVELELSARCAGRLRELAQREGATLFMVLLAGFGALLHRYTGQEDLLVGSPIANRSRPEVAQLIGLFVNTLVLRLDFSGALGMRGSVARVRDTCLGAFSNAELPFERIVDAVQPERDLGRSPLVQALFALLLTAPTAGAELAGDLTSTPLRLANRSSKVDLDLTLMDAAGPLAGSLEYNTDLFDRTTVLRLGCHLLRLLDGGAGDPEAPLAELSWLDETERHQLVTEWNDTAAECLPPLLVHELFERQAARQPETIAVGGQDVTLSYGELESRANRMARYLRRLGVRPETRVGLCLERSPEMVVALLAILKAGGAYVPFDVDQPAARQALAMVDSAPVLLLTDERCLERLQGLGPALPERCVCLDRHEELIAAEAGSALGLSAVGPENLAYVLYTSGSTGQPKGVGLPHRAVVNFLRAMAQRPGLGAADVVPALTTLTFDIAGLEIYLPLAVGGRVEVVDRGEAADGRRLAARLAACEATAMQATPATWRLLVDAGWEGRPGLKALCGGEALPRDLASALLSRGLELWNLYGPTETAVWSSVQQVAPKAAPEGVVGLGRPIANTQFHVVDRGFELMPAGVPGHLLIGGEGVARGYWNRPELTAERFVPDPFSGATAGGRLYRTGDLVRCRPDGTFEFLGRIDHQVKVRGFRIELGEIEAALTSHPAVSEAVVLARAGLGGEAEPGELRLAAYVVPRQMEMELEAGDLRSYLRERLPAYMLPASFTFLPELPRTLQGKLARQALPAPEGARERQREALVLPRDLVELELANLWEELLGVHPVGVHDNFFALGGHSLLAVSLMTRIERRFGRALPLSQLFAEATVAALARSLRHARSPGGSSPLVEIQRGESGRAPLFLVHPAGGQVLCYLPLARALGKEQPVYGFQDPGASLEGEPHFEVAEMAALYLDALREAQPSGPYLLGGWSLGGTLAQEMARRLEHGGDEVGLLLLIDARCPIEVGGEELSDEDLLLWFASQLGVPIAAEELLEQPPAHRLLFVLKRCQAAGRLPADFAPPQAQRILRLFSAEMSALARHRPGSCRCPTLLLRAAAGVEEEAARGEDTSLGWRNLIGGGTETVVVPGAHQTLLAEPQVSAVAREIRIRLDGANRRRPDALGSAAAAFPGTVANGAARP